MNRFNRRWGVFLGLAGLLAGILAAVQAGMGMMGPGPGMGMGRSGMMGMSMQRHRYVMRNGLEERYRNRRNPLPATPAHIAEGQRLYQSYCAACHGPSGRGDGPAGRNLDPPPANIARFAKMPMASDAYLLWTISKGGQPVGSAMPPFESALTQEEIWKIILYLRRL